MKTPRLSPEFQYRLKTQRERVAPADLPAGYVPIELDVVCLDNLDETIDALFLELSKTGDESLLEELCPYFGTVWPSARALAEEVLVRFPKALQDREKLSVLEVGCGLAVPSLLARSLGAQVTATDFHPEVPNFLDRNLEKNRIEGLRYVRMDWQDPGAHPELAGQRFDWVIGSDVLYEKQHPAHVAQALLRWVKPKGLILLADPARPYLQPFVDEMKRLGLDPRSTVRRVTHSGAPQGVQDIFVLAFEALSGKPDLP